MNKLEFLALAVLAAGTTTATAQENGRYVRKAVRPGFFIPEKEFDRQERLPEFPAIESGLIKVTDEGVMIRVSDSDADTAADRQQPARPEKQKETKGKTVHLPYLVKKHNLPAAEPEYNPPADIKQADEPVIVPPPAPKAVYTPEDGLGGDLSRDEAYLRKEKAYEEDLKAMAETGAMPENAELEADLEKMNSSVSFSVN